MKKMEFNDENSDEKFNSSTLSKFLIIGIFEILTSQKFIHYNLNVDFKIFTHKIFTLF